MTTAVLTCTRCGMQEQHEHRDTGRRLCSVCNEARISATWCALSIDQDAPGYRIAREITRLRLPIVMACALLRMGQPDTALRVLEVAEPSQVSIPPVFRDVLIPRQRRATDVLPIIDEELPA